MGAKLRETSAGFVIGTARPKLVPGTIGTGGAELPAGTYYWILEGLDVSNKPVKRSGSVTLIR